MKADASVKTLSTILIDLLAILFIAFMGDIVKITNYPLYILDPMRIMVFIAIAFTFRWNAYSLALLLPLVSFLLGGHPYFLKTALMMAELALNVWLFFFLIKHLSMPLLSALMSIIFTKAAYYLLKFLFIKQQWITGDLLSTPLEIQIYTTLSISIFIAVVIYAKGKIKERSPA